MTEQRRLAAILVADVVGYSTLVGKDEAGTLARLNALRSDIVDPAIARHAGRLFKSMGDGFLVEFASAVQAVSCARAIQDTNSGELKLRIGIHLGDVVVQGDDLLGDGVNIAARVEGVAEPGGIAISRQVHDQVRDKFDMKFVDKGQVELKNLVRPVRVFAVGGTASGSDATPLALPDKPSIAVLPFQNMSGDPEQEYFADGISEDIITELARFRSLFVIARNSSFTYKGRAVDIKQVGRELGVRYVLEGSVRKAGDRVRLTGQLVDTQTGSHIWAERYDRKLDDVFAVQEELTRSIVRAISPHISEAELARVRRRRPESLSAYEISVRAYAAAWDAWVRSDPALCDEAMRLAGDALAIDPENANALFARGLTNLQHYVRNTARDREATWREGFAAIERIIELDRSHGGAHALRGTFLVYAERFDEALASARLGQELNPHDVPSLVSLTFVEHAAGDPERAIVVGQEALRLSPRDPMRPHLLQQLAMASFKAGHYAESIDFARRGIAEAPTLPPLHAFLAASLAALGRVDEARPAFAAARRTGPEFVERMLSGQVPRRDREAVARSARFLRLAGGLDEPAAAGSSAPALALPDKPSIAVLPFQNMSGDPEQEYFTDGVSEDIITELSRFRELFVIARNSSFTYKGRAVDIKQVGRELGVRYVLEGSIRRSAGRIRVTAQLIETQSGAHVWAERYDRDLQDVFAVQEEVTHAIASALAPEIAATEQSRAMRRRPQDIGAYEIALRAWSDVGDAHQTTDLALMTRAVEGARRALVLDPNSVLAWQSLSYARQMEAWHRFAGKESELHREALEAADRAIALDGADARSHALRAHCSFTVRDFAQQTEALVEARRAYAMNPNDTFVLYLLSNLEGGAGDPERAIEHCQQILRLNPRDNRVHIIYTLLAFACVAAKRWAEGAAWAARSVNDSPRNWPGYTNLVSCLVGLGEIEKAKATLNRMRELFPDRVERYVAEGRGSHARPEVLQLTRVFRRIAAGLEDPSAAEALR